MRVPRVSSERVSAVDDGPLTSGSTSPGSQPMTYLRRGARSFRPFIGLLAFIGLWEVISVTGLMSPLLLPPPQAVVEAGVAQAESGILWRNAAASLTRVAIGYALAVVVGVGAGLIAGWYRPVQSLVGPVIEALRPIPAIAWIPLAILWFGLTERASYYVVFIAPVFPIFVGTVAAVQATSNQYVNAALCLGAKGRSLLFNIVFPAALPNILTQLRIGVALAWTAVVAAELVAAQSGLGYQMQLARELFRTDHVIFGMVTIGALGAVSNLGMLFVERHLLNWRRGTTVG